MFSIVVAAFDEFDENCDRCLECQIRPLTKDSSVMQKDTKVCSPYLTDVLSFYCHWQIMLIILRKKLKTNS